MALLKLLILVCGGLGLGIVLSEDIVARFEHDMVTTLFIVGGFAVATLMGLLALFKPPFESWQATAALAGFVVVGIKTTIWKSLPEIMKIEDLVKPGQELCPALAIYRPAEHVTADREQARPASRSCG